MKGVPVLSPPPGKDQREQFRGDASAKQRPEMRLPVEFQRIEQVLDVHAGVSVAFEAQAAVEEQGIRVFALGGQQPEIIEAAADSDVRLSVPCRL